MIGASIVQGSLSLVLYGVLPLYGRASYSRFRLSAFLGKAWSLTRGHIPSTLDYLGTVWGIRSPFYVSSVRSTDSGSLPFGEDRNWYRKPVVVALMASVYTFRYKLCRVRPFALLWAAGLFGACSDNGMPFESWW
jgi:hypothetical protein